MRVVRRSTLRAAYTVRIMASIAGRILAAYVLVVLAETIVIENTVPAMAAVAQSIIRRAFGSVIQRNVVANKYGLKR